MTDEHDAQDARDDAQDAQLTLSGEPADQDTLADRRDPPRDAARDAPRQGGRPRPRTLVWCPECDEWFKRTAHRSHPHVLVDGPTEYQAYKILEAARQEDRDRDCGFDFGAGDVLTTRDGKDAPGARTVYSISDDDLDGDDDDGDDGGGAEVVGKMYDIRLSYSVDYSFKIPAHSERDAERRAKEMVRESKPVDRHHVHTRTDERAPVFADDDAADDLEGC